MLTVAIVLSLRLVTQAGRSWDRLESKIGQQSCSSGRAIGVMPWKQRMGIKELRALSQMLTSEQELRCGKHQSCLEILGRT